MPVNRQPNTEYTVDSKDFIAGRFYQGASERQIARDEGIPRTLAGNVLLGVGNGVTKKKLDLACQYMVIDPLEIQKSFNLEGEALKTPLCEPLQQTATSEFRWIHALLESLWTHITPHQLYQVVLENDSIPHRLITMDLFSDEHKCGDPSIIYPFENVDENTIRSLVKDSDELKQLCTCSRRHRSTNITNYGRLVIADACERGRSALDKARHPQRCPALLSSSHAVLLYR